MMESDLLRGAVDPRAIATPFAILATPNYELPRTENKRKRTGARRLRRFDVIQRDHGEAS